MAEDNKTPTNTNPTPEQNEGAQEEKKSYTQEEVLALLQSETDKRVTAALKKQEKKYTKQLSLSGLDEDSRKTAEKDIRIQELEEQLKELSIAKNKNEVIKVLTSRNLNPAFADLIHIGDDVEEAQARIDALDKLVKKEIQEGIKKGLASGAPKVGATDTSEVTPEKFKKMTLAQKAELQRTQPDLFNKLTK